MAHEGVVIKTMGDAVMATFINASHCAAAAIAILERFEGFRAAAKHGTFVTIKLGMWAGARYVVNANGVLDYFGQTVNVGSRVQHLANASEFVLPRELYEAMPEAARA